MYLIKLFFFYKDWHRYFMKICKSLMILDLYALTYALLFLSKISKIILRYFVLHYVF